MKHLPLFFDLVGRKVVVVGLGAEADRRANLVQSAGAKVVRLSSDSTVVADFRGSAAAFIATGTLEGDTAAQRVAKRLTEKEVG